MQLSSDEYLHLDEKDKRRKLGEEVEELEMEFSGAKEKANEYLESCKDEILSLQLMLQKRLAFVESKKEWRIRVWRNL